MQGDSKSYVALQAWAVLESRVGNYSAARELFQRSLEIAPKSIYAMQSWANMEIQVANLERLDSEDGGREDYFHDDRDGDDDEEEDGQHRNDTGLAMAEKILSKALRYSRISNQFLNGCNVYHISFV